MVRRHALPVAAVLTYLSYFIAATAFFFADGPALLHLLGSAGYKSWTILFFISSFILLLGATVKQPLLEIVGTLPTAASLIVYAISILNFKPYGQFALGIAGSAIIGAGAWWLVLRCIYLTQELDISYTRRDRR